MIHSVSSDIWRPALEATRWPAADLLARGLQWRTLVPYRLDKDDGKPVEWLVIVPAADREPPYANNPPLEGYVWHVRIVPNPESAEQEPAFKGEGFYTFVHPACAPHALERVGPPQSTLYWARHHLPTLTSFKYQRRVHY